MAIELTDTHTSVTFCPFQHTRFRCKLCNDDYTYRRRSGVIRHLQEQHSGFTYKCSLCGRMLSRAQTHVKCSARSSDMILFHRETGLRGAEAQKRYDIYQNELIDNHWEEVLPPFDHPEMLSPLPPSPTKRKSDVIEPIDPPKRRCVEEEAEESAWENDPTNDITLEDDIKSLVSEPDPRFQGIYFPAPTRLSDSPSTTASSPIHVPAMKSIVQKISTEKCLPPKRESLFDFKNLERLNKEKNNKTENSHKKRKDRDVKTENTNKCEKNLTSENSKHKKCAKDTKTENSTKPRGEKGDKIENFNKKRSEKDTQPDNSNRKRSEKDTKHENSNKNKCEKDTKTENSNSNQNSREKNISNKSEKDTKTESNDQKKCGKNLTNENSKQKCEKDTKIENSDSNQNTREQNIPVSNKSEKDTKTESNDQNKCEKDTKIENSNSNQNTREQNIPVSNKSEKDTKTESNEQNKCEKNTKTENSDKKFNDKDASTENCKDSKTSVNLVSDFNPSSRGASMSVMDDLYLSDSDDLFSENLDDFEITEKDVDMDTEGYHRLLREVVKLNHREATPVVPIQKEQLCNPVLKKVVYKTFNFYQKTQEKRVLLNIGGKIFQTSRVTLKADPTSVFAVMFRRGCPFRPYARDTYYFDRDPSHFRFILNYLRNGGYLDIMTLPHEKKYLLELLQEARFYMMGGLEELIVRRLRQVTRSDDTY